MVNRRQKGIPRWADATVAAIGLVLMSPLAIIIGLAIAATSGSPILFRQKRVGRNGRQFDVFKFRTMTLSQTGPQPQVTSSNDGRITRLGRVLRKTKLDEMPTLWNVLRGDMALVGPRPEVPRYVNENDPQWRLILAVRPGITDPTTLSLRNEEELLARAHPDVEKFYVTHLQPAKLSGYINYLQQRTLGTDVRVIYRTLAEVIRHS
jgi:lipopolysaccharide/colanic/teichoic acid biosynthesis glycosyltransferase